MLMISSSRVEFLVLLLVAIVLGGGGGKFYGAGVQVAEQVCDVNGVCRDSCVDNNEECDTWASQGTETFPEKEECIKKSLERQVSEGSKIRTSRVMSLL